MAEGTPMMIQYHKIKDKLPDCILFFRLGDFYEMFNEDAVIAARELDLALTTRDRSRPPEEQTPMCGVPYHAYESYVARLLSKGYKVAVCEQLEDPALAGGLVDRDVIRIITPGTVIEHSMLEENRPNYISSVFLSDNAAAVCFADISTGEFLAAEFQGKDCPGHIVNELVRYAPSEVILNDQAAEDGDISLLLKERMNCMCHSGRDYFDQSRGSEYFSEHFNSVDPASVSPEVISAAGALLSYLHETQKTSLKHIDALTLYSSGRYMELDWQTRRNLELTETMRSQDKKGSLLWVLDKTRTSMGGRLLRSMIEKPLLSPAVIKQRLNAVAELADGTVLRGELRDALKNIDDIERLTGRIVYGNSNARDLAALASSAAVLPQIKALLTPVKSALLQKTAAFDELAETRALIDAAIGDDPPFSVREGGMVRPGYSDEVDRLRGLTENAREAVASIESAERERTGIKKLRIGYNKVFGYYIEIPRSQSETVPDNYIRRQTLVNCERFITEELKVLESQLLTAHDRLTQLEYQIFKELTDAVSGMASVIRHTAADIALLDALCSLAETAVKNGYCMPEVDVSGVIDIRDGRHPVVERAQRDTLFVPNDTVMDTSENRVAIITGPNMAGKSTYMRQTALIVLMAQIGSFVPARSARIGIADRIFTRIGASDDLAAGQSTFMVEMTEVASILKNAGPNSLLILDEIGRGTSTYDGMAIARALLEYCADTKKLGARTMFATHYHELTRLGDTLSCVKNLSTAVKKRGDDVIFLRRIVHGGADRSYGIEVAKLAGVPDSVIKRAKDVLSELEKGAGPVQAAAVIPDDDPQLSLSSLADSAAAARIRACEPETLTPIEAMNFLYELKKMLD
ncbi:MAG: DNA mismatch repair protein MutS [Oscillospiraceae bacterium]|nr:DNA mismatch repair protein MutS [Oscillospiraceae bacterium]